MSFIQIITFVAIGIFVICVGLFDDPQKKGNGIWMILIGATCALIDWCVTRLVCDAPTSDIFLLAPGSCIRVLMAFAYFMVGLGTFRFIEALIIRVRKR